MTDLSRRTVLGAGASAVAVATVGVSSVPAVAATPVSAPIPVTRRFTSEAWLYRRKRFLKRRRSRFWVVGPGVRQIMVLSAVRDIPSVAKGSARSFELTFKATRRGPEQGTYALKRRRFTSTSLFLVPTDATRRTYRATINNR